MFMPKPDTTRRYSKQLLSALFLLGLLLTLAPLPGGHARAEDASFPPQDQGRIRADVNLVVLHATVVDERGRFVPDLKEQNFRVLEDRVEQKLALFKREDIPVTLGLVIDNSGSMRDKRDKVNAAALTFVKTSSRDDEVFVVNFNDDYFLDLPTDITSSIDELKEALERIDSRGSTALYDAIIGSVDHIKKGSRDKKVLLVITDGEDNTSRANLERTILEVQRSDAVIYTVGILGKEKGAKRARRALQALSQATGGLAFFPEAVGDVEAICTQIAHDIRNQYTLAYYPTNTRKDGTFRNVQVEVIPPRGRGKLSVRTRTGYYAQREASGN
jgi:VWFA-related protein